MKSLLFSISLLVSLSASSQADTALCKEFPFSGTGIYYSTRFTNLQFIGTLSTPIIQNYKANAVFQTTEPKIIGRLFIREVNHQSYYSKYQNGLIRKSIRGGNYQTSNEHNDYDGGVSVLMKDSIYLEGSVNINFSPTETISIDGYILFEGLPDRYPLQLTLLPDYNSFELSQYLFHSNDPNKFGVPRSLKEVRGIRLGYVDELKHGVPDTLKYCTNLESLWLNGIPNQPLPDFIFTDLTRLKNIRITQAYGEDWYSEGKALPFVLPVEVFLLPEVKIISLGEFKNLQIPDEIPEENTIESFELLYCDLENGLPPTFSNLTHLKTLKIYPILSVIPANMNRFSKLEKLSIQIGKAKIPEGFGPWPNLKELDLGILNADPAFVSQLVADHPNAVIKINGKKVN